MAATVQVVEFNGAQLTQTLNTTTINWKSVDDAAVSHTDAPVVIGTCSFEKWLAVKFTGTYNQVGNVKFGHTAGSFGAGIKLKASPSMVSAANQMFYSTPTDLKSTRLTANITSVATIDNGLTAWVGGTSPNHGGKTPVTADSPTWSTFIVTQLQTKAEASTGATNQATFTVQWSEN